MKNIVLIGYRGTGKSEVSRLLAERLGWARISTDEAVEARLKQSITDFVAENGWPAFRDAEADVVAEAAQQSPCVIDTGGGAVLRPANVDRLRRTGALYWLTAAPAAIRDRIAECAERPSLTGSAGFLDEIEQVLAERMPIYAAAADAAIATDGRSPAEAAEAILAAHGAAGDG